MVETEADFGRQEHLHAVYSTREKAENVIKEWEEDKSPETEFANSHFRPSYEIREEEVQ